MKPKVSWELLDRGSLRLRIISGDRDVSWTIGKTADLDRVYNVLEEMQIEINRSRDVTRPALYPAEWAGSGIYDEPPEWAVMNETVRTVDQEELDALREAASLKALSDKAASVTLTGGNFWGNDDLSSLDLYELGTGDPE